MRLHPVPTLFDRLFDEPRFAAAAPSASFHPVVDVVETQSGYEVTADLPGVASDAVGIEFADGVLEIRGERDATSPSEDARIVRSERPSGSFRRRFRFSEEVDVDAIEATVKDGVLHVSIPKSEKARARQIPLTVN